MGTTSRGFRYPEASDPPNSPLQVHNLADDVQAELDSNLTLGGDLTVPGNLIIGAGAIRMNPLLAIKTAGESVSSSTTPQNDDHLVLSLPVASKKYYIVGGLSTDGAAANDLRICWSAPSGASGLFTGNGLHFQATDGTLDTVQMVEAFSDTDQMIFGCIAAFDHRPVDFHGVIQLAGSIGDLRLRWCQNSSGATATRILGGSYMLGVMAG